MTYVTINTNRTELWWSEAQALLKLAWPLILTNLAQISIATTDTILMGWLGPEALAAGALGVNVFYACFMFGFGLAMATAPMMAQALGARRHSVRQVRRTLRQGLWLCSIYCALAWLVLWHTEVILIWLGQDLHLAALAGDYGRAMMWGLLPALGFLVLRSFVAALERPRAALAVTLFAILLNAVVAWILMFGKFGFPVFGLAGIGISGTLANSFMFFGLLGYLYISRRFRRYHIIGRFWRSDLNRLRELVRIGLPISFALGFEMTIFTAAIFLMGLVGTSALAAHQIALQIASTTFMVPLGLSQAATVRVGLAIGAGDPQGAGRAGWSAIMIVALFMATMAVILVTIPEYLAALFLDSAKPGNEEVLVLTRQFLFIAGIFQIADGLQSVTAGTLRGLKDTRVPMIYAGIGYWIIGFGLSAGLGFGAGLAGTGIWIGLAIGLGVVACLMLWRWNRREELGLVG